MRRAGLVDEMRRSVGLFVSLAVAVAWALVVAERPDTTVHLAPLVIAGAWVGVDGAVGAGLTQRRVVNEALGGLLLAGAVTAILAAKGDLDGPTVWGARGTLPVVTEHLLSAALGALLGGSTALWRSARPPRAP